MMSSGDSASVAPQAGLIQGRMLNNMSAALRTNGIGALYSGYLAFILKSLPYDVAELVTYSELSRVQGPLQRIPLGCRDVLTGQPLCAALLLKFHLLLIVHMSCP